MSSVTLVKRVVGVVLAGCAGFLAVVAGFGIYSGLVLGRLGRLEPHAGAGDHIHPWGRNRLLSSAGRVATRNAVGARLVDRLNALVHLAGNPWGMSGSEYLGAAMLSTALGLSVAVVPGPFYVRMLSALLVLSPWMLLRLKIGARRRLISRSVPEMMELLSVCANAGMNLHAALAFVAENVSGPLGDELRRTVAALSTGHRMDSALRDMGQRCGEASIRLFAGALSQAYVSGSSVSEALRSYAWLARQYRRQAVEAAIQSMPTKMTVCSILFLLPPVFVMTLLPGLLMFLSSRW